MARGSAPEGSPVVPSTDGNINEIQKPGEGPPAVPQPVDYTDLYERIKDKPCRVVQINQQLEGFNGRPFRTRSDIIERELEPIHKAQTLSEVHEELDAAGLRLKQLGVFSHVEFVAHEEPLDDPSACTVDVHLEETNWYKIRAATYVEDSERTFELGASLTNALGNAEHLGANFEYGTENSHTASVSYRQPRAMGLPFLLELRGSQLFRNNQKASSYTEQLRGAVLGFKSLNGRHTLEYELGWRRLLDPSRSASRAVVAQMGDFLKSALRYTAVADHRDLGAGGAAAALGGAGWAVKSTTEVAGLVPPSSSGAGGSSLGTGGYCGGPVDLVANVPMDDTGAVVFSLGLSAGLLLPWGEGALSRPSCIADRFFLGGPSSLRGFKYKGAGPSDVRRPPAGTSRGEQAQLSGRRDALGGDVYTSIFASLMFQLPHPALKLLNLHGHAFVNGGNVMQLSGTGRAPATLLSDFGSTFRWSCGTGLVVPTPLGRFEANYCVILSSQEHDRVRRGIQLGFAASNM
ncbi:hypothetical protein VOLCADRAFT_116281 [Volvox carteri f. nagariensis]|uniref:Bacterial surface antigen (D15) domain-containing protein n=1 Tax=Volvox carteri f. nagariensis TaxID=3068 RepID=D8TKH0_VOLCA|nr:uncharacterized protein VOLCADRAFT_116281 [Volvox carteri f. nagariensis]EFJ52244.1 hypothetical protein VOLCADRAFT_116281 [Volvox carteri f. nagariensis]|eukprot:XP_002947018.1 hypothetical protein VOLCADRAFT_116281 [Volvox carteri f. nagariensis]